MQKSERILFPKRRIFGGALLPHRKMTAEHQTVEFPSPQIVTLPMSQHIGAPCTPVVEPGDEVFVGTLIGTSDAYVSAPIYSSVSGVVREIKSVMLASGKMSEAVVIESDGRMAPDESLKPFPVSNAADLAQAARNCGLVGLGGAGFPTQVKLTVKETTPIDTLIINAAECEPYIVSDYRECMENLNDLIEGIYLFKSLLNVKEVYLCVEDNKPLAIKALYRAATDYRDADNSVHVMRLPSTYPQGAEKVMIYSATGRRLPVGKLPADVGCIVMNVTSIAVLYNYIKTGMPLVSKRITVSGAGIAEPKNVKVPIGVSVEEVLEFCGGLKESAKKVLFGGPMMGTAMFDFSVPITRQCNAITVLDEENESSSVCISCGRCHMACPMNLFPGSAERVVASGDPDAIAGLNSAYCLACGSCSFVCPAKRPIAEAMNIAKIKERERASK